MLDKIYKITKSDNIIVVENNTLSFYVYENKYNKIFQTEAIIGEKGLTLKKKEGDGKTPKGLFKLGIAFGLHDIKINKDIEYVKINNNLYWVDDINSKYYNKLVDISKVKKDWNSAEHLIKYKTQYEYGIEIKTNPNNIKGKGSAIFLHCKKGNKTKGCIAIEKEKMIKLLKLINKKTLILIK